MHPSARFAGTRHTPTLPPGVGSRRCVEEPIPSMSDESPPRPAIRGVYGGVPTQIFERGGTLADYGINAVWLGSGSLTPEGVGLLKVQGARVFAEFNSMHAADYLAEHPEAAPVGPDGEVCPPPDGWQGVCPTHE